MISNLITNFRIIIIVILVFQFEVIAILLHCIREIVPCNHRPVSAVIRDIAIDAVGLGFNSRASQIEHRVANRSPPPPRAYIPGGMHSPKYFSRGDDNAFITQY